MLHSVVGGGNTYCGPAALASIFCITPRDAAAVIRDVTGKTKVFGVHQRDIKHAVRELGGTLTQLNPSGPRVHLDDFAKTLADGVYLVCVTGHYVALEVIDKTIEVCDNHTIYPRDVARYSMRRKCVKTAWRITVPAVTPARPPSGVESFKRAALKLARALGGSVRYDATSRHLFITVDAPVGYHFANSELHSMQLDEDVTTDAKRDDCWRDMFNRMSCGLESCDPKNHTCADVAYAEVEAR